jgi:ribokinase
MKLITGGGLRIDYLITHDGQTHTGLVGGNALYAAVGAAIWTDDVGLWARAGENYPQEWLEALRPHGLGIEGVVRVSGEQDHRTFYAYTSDGRRDDTNPAAHFARINRPLPESLRDYIHSTPGQDDPHRYEPLSLRPEDWPRAWGAGQATASTAVHLSPLALSTHAHVPPALRQRGISQITVDPGERYMSPSHIPTIRRFLPYVDVFLPSDQEVRSLFGENADLWRAADTLCQWGAPTVVVKHGAKGVLVQEGIDGRRIHQPAYHPLGDPRVVDVTGAGDAFCGGFMVGLMQADDPLSAARMGLVSASFAIEGYGALFALKNSDHKASRLADLPPIIAVR